MASIVIGVLVSLIALQASAQVVTLTMDELPTQPVNGLTFKGVTFGFTVGGIGSTDALYDAGNGGQQTFTQDPVIEGNAAGVLTLDFAMPTPRLEFGVSLLAAMNLSPGFVVMLFDANLNPIGTTPVDANILIFFPEGQFLYQGTPVRRAVITFNTTAARFGFDNLTFIGGPAPAPAMGTWGLMSLCVLLFGIGAMRVRAAQAS